MQIWHSSSSEGKPCIICGKKTGTFKVYEQTNITVRIPACYVDCYEKVDVRALADLSIKAIKSEIKRGNSEG